jgi:lysyl-tRNA synthetase class 2
MTNIAHFQTIQLIRDFFRQEGFLETPTPPIVKAPGMEAHLEPFEIKHAGSSQPLFLHTSPEFYMKKLLSEGHKKIYSLSYCFRNEPSSETHRPQFLMLEWYRANCHYETIKKDAITLIESVREGLEALGHEVNSKSPVVIKTVDQLFKEELNFSILNYLEVEQIKDLIKSKFPELIGSKFEETLWPWEDYFFLLFLNKIEPTFKKYDVLLVDEFPAPLAALSTLKESDPRVCERFEVYLAGIELCNCFNELTDLEEQRKRYFEENQKRKLLYNKEIPEPRELFDALERGIPSSAGIALGVERLLLGLIKNKEINPFFN